MSVSNEPILPPPTVPPVDNPTPDPDRVPGEEPPPGPEPDEVVLSASEGASHCPTWGMLCSGIRLQPEDRT
jgi:hypothetical protein